MYAQRKVLAVVPARGGSKGVPLKNLRKIGGTSLVGHVGQLVRELGWIDRAVVSTDHPEIARTAEQVGLAAPFWRPAELSGDRIGDIPVLQHALQTMESIDGCEYDIILMLQPTSPLRLPDHVAATVEKLVQGNFDAVWTVSPTDLKYHPLKQLALDDDAMLGLWDQRGTDIIARQQLKPVYHRNGAAYALTRACLLTQSALMGARSAAVVIDTPMLSIDSEDDLNQAECLLNKQASQHAPQLRVRQEGAAAPFKTFVVDIDGVLASLVSNNDYTLSQPLQENIAIINRLHEAGHRIILFTARGSATGIDWQDVTRKQMTDWNVRYHALQFGKPAADYYIDDRLITLQEALQHC
ncbi:cytidylyltransferase domain-containing protein [Nitrosomonas sp. ANs5]|uniref:acylneuraminate cytidylyltransferase family protein n=1 Tax=Nitrosomonas sp. ANs5 TaxID=3423941 RepID=UPI003D342B7C